MDYREEVDAMGTVRVPVGAYYGAQTQRAIENFPVSNTTLPPSLTRALATIKAAAARVNAELELLPDDLGEAICAAAEEVAHGNHDDQFRVDVFQTGSATSTNMNANEVIAGRANEILSGQRGGRSPVHPNDHVNLGQSSNDVIPTAIHLAALDGFVHDLGPALAHLEKALADKADAFAGIAKLGRTHLQDAVPMTLGQAFSGHARQVALARRRCAEAESGLAELALGGTAVGTGLNTHPEFAGRAIARLAAQLNLPLVEARNHFSAQSAQDAAVAASGALKATAVSLVKIANDIRWMASGPRSGIGEITIPSLQPGSSIMPGKVNPVIPESVIQAAYQVMGNDLAVTLGGQSGAFELNVTLPLIARNLLESIQLVSATSRLFVDRCISGIEADAVVCGGYIEKSLALVTGLVPHLGYDRASELAKRAHATGRTIREIVRAETDLSDSVIESVLGPEPAQ